MIAVFFDLPNSRMKSKFSNIIIRFVLSELRVLNNTLLSARIRALHELFILFIKHVQLRDHIFLTQMYLLY